MSHATTPTPHTGSLWRNRLNFKKNFDFISCMHNMHLQFISKSISNHLCFKSNYPVMICVNLTTHTFKHEPHQEYLWSQTQDSL